MTWITWGFHVGNPQPPFLLVKSKLSLLKSPIPWGRCAVPLGSPHHKGPQMHATPTGDGPRLRRHASGRRTRSKKPSATLVFEYYGTSQVWFETPYLHCKLVALPPSDLLLLLLLLLLFLCQHHHLRISLRTYRTGTWLSVTIWEMMSHKQMSKARGPLSRSTTSPAVSRNNPTTNGQS